MLKKEIYVGISCGDTCVYSETGLGISIRNCGMSFFAYMSKTIDSVAAFKVTNVVVISNVITSVQRINKVNFAIRTAATESIFMDIRSEPIDAESVPSFSLGVSGMQKATQYVQIRLPFKTIKFKLWRTLLLQAIKIAHLLL